MPVPHSLSAFVESLGKEDTLFPNISLTLCRTLFLLKCNCLLSVSKSCISDSLSHQKVQYYTSFKLRMLYSAFKSVKLEKKLTEPACSDRYETRRDVDLGHAPHRGKIALLRPVSSWRNKNLPYVLFKTASWAKLRAKLLAKQ